MFVFSLFVFNKVVAASENNMAMWLDCDYSVYEKHVNKLEKDRPIVFIGGWNTANKQQGHYRLLNPDIFNKVLAVEQNWYDHDNPLFDPTDNNISCWFKDIKDIGKSCNDKEAKKYEPSEALQMLRKGVCPAMIRDSYGTWSNEAIVFAGEGITKNAYKLTNQYRVYKSDTTGVYAYGYDVNGFLTHFHNGEFVSTFSMKTRDIFTEIIMGSSATAIEKHRHNFMNVGEMDFSGVFVYKDAQIIFDSNDNIDKLYSAVDNWYLNYATKLDSKSGMINNIRNNYEKTINYCNDLNSNYDNNLQYNFSNSYTADNMLDDLKKLHGDLKYFYDNYSNKEKNQYDLCVSEGTTSTAIFSAYNCSMKELIGGIHYIPEGIQNFIMTDIERYLVERKKIDLDETDILETALKCSSYLDMYYDEFNLDENVTSKLSGDYAKMAKNKGLSFIYDCESLLGSDLINKINSYLDIIKIIIPLILIGFGVIDFTKAIFSGEENMKKAQKNFMTRIFISILIFLTPTLVNLILKLANIVWQNISPNSCGLF